MSKKSSVYIYLDTSPQKNMHALRGGEEITYSWCREMWERKVVIDIVVTVVSVSSGVVNVWTPARAREHIFCFFWLPRSYELARET
jgi:hypothetical protein